MITTAIVLAAIMIFIRVLVTVALNVMSEMPYDLSDVGLFQYVLDEVTIIVGFICIILLGLGV